ncbi:hypothetical protein JHK82_036000 [Glycine max]|uniref:Uncharacterized protein n=1 Tax=Glycine max TaxID=3847 RepID=K7LZ59_SOYBN|nr:hypothetical protein JHK87_035923 [Glycine soja]KAG4970311.1 hypothetical protein JHK85_036732 [Glycine max]KAG4976715.1 hypothetical protein JHK86_036189 [Glycine max]KAG5112731.1 hypothetical protein JHK82_036000 [Glycine max]KAG5130010.1 hypothetical protein JHK84_036407 [Glycine max]
MVLKTEIILFTNQFLIRSLIRNKIPSEVKQLSSSLSKLQFLSSFISTSCSPPSLSISHIVLNYSIFLVSNFTHLVYILLFNSTLCCITQSFLSLLLFSSCPSPLSIHLFSSTLCRAVHHSVPTALIETNPS